MDEQEIPTVQVNPAYARLQIAEALITSQQHEDSATRKRAKQKITKWQQVLSGIESGSIDVGSRTPVANVPAWATLEVVTGGFATGELLAAGPLLEHERTLLDRISARSEADARRVLNAYFLSDPGLANLRDLVRSGCFDIAVPEEGALLVVAWLVEQGAADQAHELLDRLAPYFSKLRFYPAPAERPRRFGSRVFVQAIGDTIRGLNQIRPNSRILAQKEAIQVWIPLYDKTVALFMETIEGATPHLRCGADGMPLPRTNGKFPVEGGWPCSQYPDGWKSRAQVVLEEYDRLREQHKFCRQPDRAKGSFAKLRSHLRQCIADPKSLSGRDVGGIRLILARYVAKRGVPDSASCRAFRERQQAQASASTHHHIAQVVIARLQPYPKDEGLDNLAVTEQPVTAAEAAEWDITSDTIVPAALQRKVERCLSETVDVLVERGVITSGETLARVLPQMTSGLRAAGIKDPMLRQLYAAIYCAFRRRRSLLLLDLASQVKIEELPWVNAIDRFRSEDLSSCELAKQTLEEVTVLTLVSFPHAIVPNKLLQELRTLIHTARLDAPIVDELAADIFMGKFSDKFRQAAIMAANLLENTVYQTYYGIDFERIRNLHEIKPTKRSWFARKTSHSDPLCELCSSMAGVRIGTWNPATNGMIIEQQQIVTTQNLAVLFEACSLTDKLRHRLTDMAKRCFTWICARLQIKNDRWHARLISVKNAAYAWRQMIFYLALLRDEEVHSVILWLREHLKEQTPEFQDRFAPAVEGLDLATNGLSPDAMLKTRRFTGWSKEQHWLLG